MVFGPGKQSTELPQVERAGPTGVRIGGRTCGHLPAAQWPTGDRALGEVAFGQTVESLDIQLCMAHVVGQ